MHTRAYSCVQKLKFVLSFNTITSAIFAKMVKSAKYNDSIIFLEILKIHAEVCTVKNLSFVADFSKEISKKQKCLLMFKIGCHVLSNKNWQ